MAASVVGCGQFVSPRLKLAMARMGGMNWTGARAALTLHASRNEATKEALQMSLINTKIKPFKATAFKDGKFIPVTEQDVLGKWAVFFFYPADFTFVCPTELGDVADHYAEFQKLGVEIYSVSTDTHFTHKAWHDASDTIRKIKYTMIGDPTGALTRNFENMREDEGLADRGTFIVDPQGVIQAMEVTAEGIGRDAADLLRKVKAAQYVASHPGEVCPAKWSEGAETLKPSLDLVGKI
jgi:peroxiredoxin (alkyl hydroperoxide reductase subunit C)